MNNILIWCMIWFHKNAYGFTNISTKLIYTQAYHETGNFKSAVFKQNNNLFGMRQPKVRKNYATGSNLGHATFKNHNDSIRDYFERQRNFKIGNINDEAYIEATVKSNYAEDKRYKEKWIALLDKVKAPIDNSILYLLFFFFNCNDLFNL